ncbi:hypothetical protein [Selenomonas ruminantium]|uniref:Uncharacterized protein n=1 Tax=Selenomonas ruminantium TaxID=971 RepID=A0A1I0Y9K3_SELRU|nr:hypothetical protein [Selenomonas ruminantium]SFB10029.1 hypothetical protein SAMN05216587_11123 [Selenomonas ruminantium]
MSDQMEFLERILKEIEELTPEELEARLEKIHPQLPNKGVSSDAPQKNKSTSTN